MQRSSTTFKRSKHSVVSKDKYCKIWLSLYSMVFVRFAWCCGKMYCSLHLFSYRGSRKESAILRWKWSLPYVWKRSTPFETLYLLRLFYDLLCQSHPTTWCEIGLTWLRSFAHWLVLVLNWSYSVCRAKDVKIRFKRAFVVGNAIFIHCKGWMSRWVRIDHFTVVCSATWSF